MLALSSIRRAIFVSCALAVASSIARAQFVIDSHHGTTTYGNLGYQASGAGDVDGDGFGDVVEASYDEVVHVWSGFDGSLLYTFVGTGDSGVAGPGDLNADGYADVLLASRYSLPGAVEARSGRDGALLYTVTDPTEAGFAISLGVIGDLNGDGAAEFIVGSDARKFVVCDGATGASVFSHKVLTAQSYASSVSGAGDVDHDGVPDYVIGAMGSPYLPGEPGFIEIFSGATNALLLHVANPVGGVAFGNLVRSCGDVDADGHADVLATRPGMNGSGAQTGIVVLISGADGSVIRTWSDNDINSAFPYALAGTGDLNGDGVGDVAAGALFANRVYLYSGADGNTIATLQGSAFYNMFGRGLAGADLDGDGISEVIVGDMDDDGATTDGGAVFVYAMGCAEPFAYCTAKANSQGCLPQISSSGVASLSTGSHFVVQVANVLNHKPGTLIWSVKPAADPFAGGVLCVATPHRALIGESGGNPPPPTDCSGDFTFDLPSTWLSTHGLGAGDTIYFQVVSRDPFFPPGEQLSLTSALRAIVCP